VASGTAVVGAWSRCSGLSPPRAGDAGEVADGHDAGRFLRLDPCGGLRGPEGSTLPTGFQMRTVPSLPPVARQVRPSGAGNATIAACAVPSHDTDAAVRHSRAPLRAAPAPPAGPADLDGPAPLGAGCGGVGACADGVAS